MSSSTVGSTSACAACKYQRKKCIKDCLLASYFPQTNQNQFLNAYIFFGVGNITKMIREVDEPLRDIAMQNLFIHANARAQDPVGELCRILSDYRQKIESAEAELHQVKQQIAFYCSRDQQQQRRQDLSFGCYSYGDLLPQQVDYGHVDGYANQNMPQKGMDQQLYQEIPQQQQQQYQEIPLLQHQQISLNYGTFTEMPESSSRLKFDKEEQDISHQQKQFQEILQQLQHQEMQQHQQSSLNYEMFSKMSEPSSKVKLEKAEQNDILR